MAKLLLNIFKNKIKIKWKDEHQRAFKDLKQRLPFAHMLKFPNFAKLFEIHTNASDFIIGKIFMQQGHLIAFESKNF
jgi:hypothetical protein